MAKPASKMKIEVEWDPYARQYGAWCRQLTPAVLAHGKTEAEAMQQGARAVDVLANAVDAAEKLKLEVVP